MHEREDHGSQEKSRGASRRTRRAGAALATLVGVALLGAVPAASAAPAPGFQTLKPVCSPDLPVNYVGCAAGTEYRGAPLPSGTPGQTLELNGRDRYGTAVAIAEHGFPEATAVVLVSGENRNLVDALSTAPLARSLAAPVLLTRNGSLPAATADYLRDKRISTVLLVGGTTAITPAVEEQLRALGVADVGRVQGANRYATSRAVAALLPRTAHAWVASGEDAHLVDALAAAGPAAGLGEPLVLVADDDPIPVGDQLRAKGVTSTTVAGGPAGVLPEALAALPAPTRAEGANRFETAVELAAVGVDRGLSATDIVLAPGIQNHLVDALASGPLGRPTLLVADQPAAYDLIEAWFDVFGAGRTTGVGAVTLTAGVA